MAKDQEQKDQEKARKEREKGQEERMERRQKTEGGEVTSDGEFTKVIRDGHVEVIPTSEVYAKEPEERIEGLEVEDRTVTAVAGGRLQGGGLKDRLERKFHSAEDGDEVSARHATGPTGSGTTPREDLEAEDTGEELEEDEKDSKKSGGKKKGK